MPDALVPVRERLTFAKLEEVLPLPDLIAIQRESFQWLLDEGIKEVLEEVTPIRDFTEQFELYFKKHHFNDSKHSEEECKDKDITYAKPLFVQAEFINTSTGEIKEQEVFMGDFPVMTERGTFIINGTERVVVSQLVRSPGVYFSRELDKTSDKDVYVAKIIPSRGAWLEFDVDKKDTVGVRIDRKRRQSVTVLLKALGWSGEEILELFDQAESIKLTLEKDHFTTPEEALEDIYRKLRPGEPPTAESARTLLENLFFNPKRYDLARVGRHKVDKKLEAAEVPCGPIYAIDEAYGDPQAKHLKLTQTVIATDGKEMTLPRQPFTLSRTPSKLMRRTPEFAEHTDELLAEFGFSAADIKGFRERGSVE